MNGDIILDSNIVINFFRNDDITIKRIAEIEKIFIPAIVIGELYYGAQKSANPSKHIAQIEKFKSYITVLPIDEQTALFYGQIKSQLKKIGKPIPENDIWIAAIAQQYQLPLMTNDKHFQNVSGISIM